MCVGSFGVCVEVVVLVEVVVFVEFLVLVLMVFCMVFWIDWGMFLSLSDVCRV